jgi:hypothetical protein
MQSNQTKFPSPEDDFFVPERPVAVATVSPPPATVSQPPASTKAPMPPSRIDRAKSVSAVLATQAQRNTQPIPLQPAQAPPPIPARSSSVDMPSTTSNIPIYSHSNTSNSISSITFSQSVAPPLPNRSSRAQSSSVATTASMPPMLPPRASSAAAGVSVAPPPLPQRQPETTHEARKDVEVVKEPILELAEQISVVSMSLSTANPTSDQQLQPRPYRRKFAETDGLSPSCLGKPPNLGHLVALSTSIGS